MNKSCRHGELGVCVECAKDEEEARWRPVLKKVTKALEGYNNPRKLRNPDDHSIECANALKEARKLLRE